MEKKMKSALGVINAAQKTTVGDKGWKESLREYITDPARLERAINGAMLGITVALTPVALNALAAQRRVGFYPDHMIREAKRDVETGAGMYLLGAGAGAVGGLVGGPAGSAVAAAVVAHKMVPSMKERVWGT
jgi:hypothetical protein